MIGKQFRRVVILSILAAFCFTSSSICARAQSGSGRHPRKGTAVVRRAIWEYKITNTMAEEELNKLAAEGWELVAATAYPDNAVLYFKRRKR